MLKEISLYFIRIPAFGFFISAGIISAVFVVLCRIAKYANKSRETEIVCSFPFSLLFGALFAHLLDVLAHGGFMSLLSFNELLRYGIAFSGFLLGVLFYLYLHAKVAGISYVFLLNIYAPALAIGQAWGRIGCFLGGCCFGKPCSLGLSYPEESLAYTIYGAIKIFPVQLLESFYLFLVFFVLIRMKFAYSASLYLLLVSSGRFVFEFFRGDNRGEYLMNLSPSQCVCISLFLLGSVLFLRAYMKNSESRSHR